MKKFILLICTALLLVVGGCRKEDHPALKAQTKRTVVAYIFGDIDLWEVFLMSINQMEAGWDPSTNGTLLVYLDASPNLTQFGAPVLLEIGHDTSNAIVSRVVKTYPDQDAADPKVVTQVLTDAMTLYPADSHGLIMGGHADGWFPSSEQSKAIGNSERFGSNYLDIDQLANALPTHYEFIVFHACTMAEATTLYQFRDKADYVVASVESLSAYGYPYHTATKALFTQPYADLYMFTNLSQQYYAKEVPKTDFTYMTVGAYRMSAMEALAAEVNKAMTRLNLKYADLGKYAYSQTVGSPSNKGLFSYPYSNPNDMLYFDFAIFHQRLAKEDAAAAASLKKAIERVVIQSYAASGRVDLNKEYTELSMGLSFYIPYNSASAPFIGPRNQAFYTRFAWSAASGFTPQWE